MILTTNNDPTSRGSAETIRMLKTCERVTEYTECGWFCVAGWDKHGRRLVHAHFNSAEEYYALKNPDRRRQAGHRVPGYRTAKLGLPDYHMPE